MDIVVKAERLMVLWDDENAPESTVLYYWGRKQKQLVGTKSFYPQSINLNFYKAL